MEIKHKKKTDKYFIELSKENYDLLMTGKPLIKITEKEGKKVVLFIAYKEEN